jgi:hypothetical protein
MTQSRSDEERFREAIKVKFELEKCMAQVDSLAIIENVLKQEVIAEKKKRWLYAGAGVGVGLMISILIGR